MTVMTHEIIPDWMLMAYADGELPDADRAAVEAYLHTAPEAARRLAIYTRSGRALGSMFDAPMHEPPPARLVNTVRKAAPCPPWTLEKLARILAPGRWFPTLPRAMAAVSLVLTLAVGGEAWHRNAEAARTAAALNLALDTLPSAPPSVAVPYGSMAPRLSFATASGQFCRRYDRQPDQGTLYTGVACRQANGTWHIEAEAAGSASEPEHQAGVRIAGSDAPNYVDTTTDALQSGIAFGRDDETRLIAAHWQRTP